MKSSSLEHTTHQSSISSRFFLNSVFTKILNSTTDFNLLLEHQISILKLFLKKDHVTLKTGLMMLKNSFLNFIIYKKKILLYF